MPTAPKLCRGVKGTSERLPLVSCSRERTYVYDSVPANGAFRHVASISTPRLVEASGRFTMRYCEPRSTKMG